MDMKNLTIKIIIILTIIALIFVAFNYDTVVKGKYTPSNELSINIPKFSIKTFEEGMTQVGFKTLHSYEYVSNFFEDYYSTLEIVYEDENTTDYYDKDRDIFIRKVYIGKDGIFIGYGFLWWYN